MVDDLHDLHLIQTVDGLGGLVVVHQHHSLAPGTQQVEAGQGAHHMVLFVQNGVAAVTAFQKHFTHIIQIITEMEGDDVFLFAYSGDGDRLIDDSGHPAGVQRGGDDAGGRLPLGPAAFDLCLADDEAVDSLIQRHLDDLRLVAADQDAVPVNGAEILKRLGQGNHYLAGDGVHIVAEFIDQLALQHTEQVEKRQLVDAAVVYGLHVEGGDVTGGEHPVQTAVLVDNGHGGNLPLPHGAPGQIHGDGAVQLRRPVQVADLGPHVLDQRRRFKAEAIQHILGLVVDCADAHRFVFPVSQGVSQVGICDCRHDRVCVRVAVSSNIDLAHDGIPPNVI